MTFQEDRNSVISAMGWIEIVRLHAIKQVNCSQDARSSSEQSSRTESQETRCRPYPRLRCRKAANVGRLKIFNFCRLFFEMNFLRMKRIAMQLKENNKRNLFSESLLSDRTVDFHHLVAQLDRILLFSSLICHVNFPKNTSSLLLAAHIPRSSRRDLAG